MGKYARNIPETRGYPVTLATDREQGNLELESVKIVQVSRFLFLVYASRPIIKSPITETTFREFPSRGRSWKSVTTERNSRRTELSRVLAETVEAICQRVVALLGRYGFSSLRALLPFSSRSSIT